MASLANTTLTTTGLSVPPTFPAVAYLNTGAHMSANHVASHANSHFRGAWNAISYRYHEARECAFQFQNHFSTYGDGPPPAERYEQERMLFDFFSSAVSALEAYFFGAFALASTSQPADFPLNSPADERKVKPSYVIKLLKTHRNGDPLIGILDALVSDVRYGELHDARNILTHRIAPGRQFFLGGSHPPVVWNLTGNRLTADVLVLALADLEGLLWQALPAAETFALSV